MFRDSLVVLIRSLFNIWCKPAFILNLLCLSIMDQVAQAQTEPSSLLTPLSLGLISKFNSHAHHLYFWNRSTIWSLLIGLTGTIFVPISILLHFPMVSSPLHTQRGLCKSDHALSSAVKLINVFQWSLEQTPLGIFSRVSFCHEGSFPTACYGLTVPHHSCLYTGFHLLKEGCS